MRTDEVFNKPELFKQGIKQVAKDHDIKQLEEQGILDLIVTKYLEEHTKEEVYHE